MFLLGALAVALPVVFHLIRRSSKERVRFSSLMFLRQSPPRMTRRSRLEHLWLLLLRCVVLGLLALGFARPYLPQGASPPTPADTGSRVAILVDTSASMRRPGLWEAARAEVERSVSGLAPGDLGAVFVFDRDVRSVMSFDEWLTLEPGERRGIIRGRMAEMEPGWLGTDVGGALVTVAEVLEEGAGRELAELEDAKRIVLVTDLQEGSRMEALQAYDWPAGVDVEVRPVGVDEPTNAGVQLVMERDEWSLGEGEPTLRVRVSNAADSESEQFRVRWEGMDGEGAMETDAYVPPGQSRVVALAPTGPVDRGSVMLSGDAHPFDNRAFLARPGAERVKLLYLGEQGESGSSAPYYYLQRAFQDTRRRAVELMAFPAGESVPPQDWNEARLVVVTGALGGDRRQAVRSKLIGGGTVLFVLGDASQGEELEALAGVDGLGVREARPANYGMFGRIDFSHPLFAPFSDPRYSDFTKIHFWRYRAMEAERLPDANVVARLDTGEPLVVETRVGEGTLLVLASGWHPADSQLALSSKFVPLMYALLELSGGWVDRPNRYTVGDDVELAGPGGRALEGTVRVRGPEGAERTIETGKDRIRAEIPGVYSVIATGVTQIFAVNLDPMESETAPMSEDRLAQAGVLIETPETERAEMTAERRERLLAVELESRQKLWRWLIVTALVVLMLETLLAGRLTRRATMPESAAT
ncbi:MAG TPA: BatA domain-containing protein [Methylomirabilota bacterium]|nr:BatA domain-containing protein [Methylomirabilota bacterium]